MLDIKLIRTEPEWVKGRLRDRLADPDAVDAVLGADTRLRSYRSEVEELKAELNRSSKTIGLLMRDGKRDEADAAKAFSFYERSANLGDLWAACNFGLMLVDGRGTEQDLTVGIWWLRWAARKGEAKAQYNLGRAYSNGEGVPKNRRSALAWLSKSAGQGNKMATELLADLVKPTGSQL